MSDETAFIKAICEDPAADLPRLVYADWLEEHGESERAEFIRVQCELAPLADAWCHSVGVTNCECRLCTLRRRERELFRRLCKTLAKDLPGSFKHATIETTTVTTTDRSDYQFRRGFVEAVSMPLAAFAGGPCGRCLGTGKVGKPGWMFDPDSETSYEACPAKCDKGRTPGIAPALFGSQPVMAVTLTDQEPYHNGHSHCWFRAGRRQPHGAPASATLPDDLYTLLDMKGRYKSKRWASFDTPDAALTGLSAVCVAWGRSVAEGCQHGVCKACEGKKCKDCDGTGKKRGLPPL